MRVFIAGHTGMVGSAVLRQSKQAGYDVLTAKKFELNLSDAEATQRFLTREKPDAVILAAARVGGIEANRLHSKLGNKRRAKK